ncbi:MAG: hypothetical protein JWO05_2608 [Gemmatimonadetes bacterium]|nr:hypothetical protein [Gemmatimonadota bacterium]
MRFRRLALPLALTFAAAGCRRQGDAGARPPLAQFLVTTSDSAYWVASDGSALRVRGVPMQLTRIDGHFHELYVADDDRSYADALFIGQRVYARDLHDNDSTLVFEDMVAPRAALRYGRAHPGRRPLGEDENGSDDPAVVATADITILDAHGPYVSLDYHTDTSVVKGSTWHTTRRLVVDARTGERVTLAALLGRSGAARAQREGQERFTAARDSVLATRDSAARDALGSDAFHFDENSFAITSIDGAPAIAFAVPGAGEGALGSAIPLEPVLVDSIPGWPAVRETLPVATDATGAARWERRSLSLVARPTADGTGSQLVLVDSARAESAVATVSGDAVHVYWLDGAATGDGTLKDLERAFEEAARYDEAVRTAMRHTSRHVPPLARYASNSRPHIPVHLPWIPRPRPRTSPKRS